MRGRIYSVLIDCSAFHASHSGRVWRTSSCFMPRSFRARARYDSTQLRASPLTTVWLTHRISVRCGQLLEDHAPHFSTAPFTSLLSTVIFTIMWTELCAQRLTTRRFINPILLLCYWLTYRCFMPRMSWLLITFRLTPRLSARRFTPRILSYC